jgi:hypothetical protein
MTFILAVVAAISLINGASAAEPASAAAPACSVPEGLISTDGELAHVAAAIKDKHRLNISVVGTASSALSGPDGARFAYPARLEAALRSLLPGNDIKVTAHVQPRRSTADMAATLPAVLAEDKPGLVIWQAGTVDALQGIEPEDFREKLEGGVEAIGAAGADVVLMNMQYSPRTEFMLSVDPYADVMHLVAQQRGIPLFDRLAIMRYWTDEGTFDLYAATKDYNMARRVHGCIGRALAEQIISSAHLDGWKTQIKPDVSKK